jgi:hypothetical protein
MTTRSTLGPLTTLILTLTANGNGIDDVIRPSQTAVVNSFLFARYVIEISSLRPVGYTNPGGHVFRVGSSQPFRVSSPGL